MRWDLSERERRIGGWLLTFSALMSFIGAWVWVQQPEAMTYDEWSLALFCTGFGLLSGRLFLATGWPPVDLRGVIARISTPSRRVIHPTLAVLLTVLLALSGVPPSAFGPDAMLETVEVVNAASGTVHDDFEDADVTEWTVGSNFQTFKADSSAAYEGDYGLNADSDGSSDATLSITAKSYSNVSHYINVKSGCSSSNSYINSYRDGGTSALSYQLTSSNCEIILRDGGGSVSTGITLSYDTWYKIIFKNIDYSGEDYDFEVQYANGTTVGTTNAVTFDQSGVSDLDEIELYNHYDSGQIYLDFFAGNGAEIGYPVDGYVETLEASSINNGNLTLKDSGGATVATTTTDSTGYYKFTEVSDGDYSIEAGAGGYVNESDSFSVSGAAKEINFTSVSGDGNALMGQLNGYVKSDGGGTIENATVETEGGTSESTNTSGFYDLALTNATYDVKAKQSGYRNAEKQVDVAGDTPINFSLCPKPCGKNYKQTFLVKDFTTQQLDTTNTHLSVWQKDPVAEYPFSSGDWSTEGEAYLNHNSKATLTITDGDTYKLVLNNWNENTHYEELGWVANRSHGQYNITIGQTPITKHRENSSLPPDVDPNADHDHDGLINAIEGALDFDFDGIPNWQDQNSAGNDTVMDGNDTSYQNHLNEVMGPTSLGECTLTTGDEGVMIEYWDPTHSTTSFDYSVHGPDGRLYEGHKEFDREIGYWRGCVGTNLMKTNASVSEMNVSWAAMRGGESVNGSASAPPSFGDIVSGPIGSTAPSTPAGQATLFGGLGIALAGLYAAGRRVGPQTTSIPAVGNVGVPPLFAIGAPIVSLIALDLAGGGVISFATATVAANIGPIAGIAGIAGVGFLFYRRYFGGG